MGILLNTIASLYNLLAVTGLIPFFGYAESLYARLDTTLSQGQCVAWFNARSNSALCSGYISFARTLAFFLIYIIAAQTFIGYLLYKEHTTFSAQKSNERSFFSNV